MSISQRVLLASAIAALVCAPAAGAAGRGGSILVFPRVVNDDTRDTRIQITNASCRPGEHGPLSAGSQMRFGLPIARATAFPVGDTVVAARVRDVAGVLGDRREIVVRVQP